MAAGSHAILLADCHMPNMDGFELTRQIRMAEKDGGAHIPIVAITASVLDAEIERCFESGMDDFLPKPLEMPRLKATLRKWMPAYKPGLAPAEPPAVTEPKANGSEKDDTLNDDSPIDERALKDMFGDDAGTFREILQEFVEPARACIDEILDSYLSRSAPGIAAAAHKLKSSSRAIGANSLSDMCQSLEAAGKAENWDEIDQVAPRLNEDFVRIKAYVAAL